VPTLFQLRRLPRRRRFLTRTRPRQRRGALRTRHSTRSARSPSAIVTTTATKGERRGSLASPPMKTRRPSLRGAEMLPVRRSTGATCRGHPRQRLPVTLKCRRRASRRRLGATRPWVRAHVRWLPCPRGLADSSPSRGA
jgi:hypothetical protein